MSAYSASFQFIAKTGYAYTLSSCDPLNPVSFMVGNQSYDATRQRVEGFVGPTHPLAYVNVFTSNPNPTKPNQNPLRLEISNIVSPTGKSMGNSAVFYGYFVGPNGSGLGFYLNAAESRSYYNPGTAGVYSVINNDFPAILLF